MLLGEVFQDGDCVARPAGCNRRLGAKVIGVVRERLASSCPLLYRWDGSKFVFITDVLSVGPLGELNPDGSHIKPFPEDLVRLPALTPDDRGDYTLQLTDELREVDYFDQVKLLAVDHPADQAIYSNEIYASNPGPVKLFAVRAPRLPTI